MSVRIDYGGVAVGAKEDFVPIVTDKENFVDLSELEQDGLTFNNFGNPCELYSVVLDGSVSPFPVETDKENLGWWSKQITNANGLFENSIIAIFEAKQLYTSSGVSLTFDTFNNIYSSDLNIKWYRGDTILADMDFKPDTAFYFCSNKVEYYNKIVITFNALNMPYNRLKLRAIDYGMRITFYGSELRTSKIIQEMDALSANIPINTCDFTIDSNKNIEYVFEEKQPINIYFNDILRATSFVKTSKRKSKNIWQIQSEDYIGLLDSISYNGGIFVDANAVDVLKDIFSVAKVPYNIDSAFENSKITGYIPLSTCREALKQIAFAIGAVVDTSNSNIINVYALNDSVTQTIPLNRILQGQDFGEETRVTAVEVMCHTYTKTDESITVFDASESGIGENIYVVFNEPLHDLQITNGTLREHGNNFAIINADVGCILTGKRYSHTTITKRKNNPLVLTTDIENIVSVQSATLVSPSNIDNVLERCYNYYANTNTVSLRIIEGKHEAKDTATLYGTAFYGTFKYSSENASRGLTYDTPAVLGEMIMVETEYLGNKQGRIVKQRYNLNGNILIKETELRGD